MFYIYYVGSVDLDRKRNLIWVRSEVGRGGVQVLENLGPNESWMLLCKFNCMLVF